MLSVGLGLVLGAKLTAQWQPFTLQFVRSLRGQTVQVSIDGAKVKTTFAGKLAIRDRSLARMSVCGNVRGPISPGQFFRVKPIRSAQAGGRIQLAGNIVSKMFAAAQTDAQCAGLQLAVWEAVEDGGLMPDFRSGHFQARGSDEALAWAAEYYQGIDTPGDALYLWQGDGDGQSQFGPFV